MRRDALRLRHNMSLDIGPPTDDAELRAAASVSAQCFLSAPEETERWLSRLDPSDIRVARRRGRVDGMLHIIPLGQWFGGRRVPMGGIGSVAVLPEHRAQRIAPALMRTALEELHGRGMPISALYPATQPLYRSVGYEQAGAYTWYKLPAASLEPRDRTLDLRPLDKSDYDVARELYTERARRTAGNLDRNDAMWHSAFEALKEPVHAYVAANAGRPEGYVAFTQDRGRHEIRVRDLVALTAGAGRRLLTLLGDHRSQIDNVVLCAAANDPLLFMRAEQRHEITSNWAWMLRVIDVRGALAARGYAAGLETDVHLEVRDDVLPWNDGRFVLEVSGGRGRVRKGGRGRLRVDVRGLAPLYTGRLSARELVATGYVEGPDRELSAASSAFAGPAPWMPDFF